MDLTLCTTPHRFPRGYSLIELVVSIVIGTLLAVTGIPWFYTFVQNQRITTEVNRIIGHLHLARTAAITTGTSVVVCKSETGTDCVAQVPRGADWNSGWIVFIDKNDNGIREPEERLLQARSTIGRQITMTFNQPGRIRYSPMGHARTGTLTVCDHRGARFAKAITLYWTGRARLTAEGAAGGPLKCGPETST